jgi:exonuclease VII small subunit
MSDAPDFETALKRLEEIVKKLETGELSLDSALQLFDATPGWSKPNNASRFC